MRSPFTAAVSTQSFLCDVIQDHNGLPVSPDNEIFKLLCFTAGYRLFRLPSNLLQKLKAVASLIAHSWGKRADAAQLWSKRAYVIAQLLNFLLQWDLSAIQTAKNINNNNANKSPVELGMSSGAPHTVSLDYLSSRTWHACTYAIYPQQTHNQGLKISHRAHYVMCSVRFLFFFKKSQTKFLFCSLIYGGENFPRLARSVPHLRICADAAPCWTPSAPTVC